MFVDILVIMYKFANTMKKLNRMVLLLTIFGFVLFFQDSWVVNPSKMQNSVSKIHTSEPTDIFPFCITSSYFGGADDEKGIEYNFYDIAGIAVDSQNNYIVLGKTKSDDFPTLNAIQPERKGDFDVTISKFSYEGELIFSTYFGGSGTDNGNGLVIDSEDNIVIGGITNSIDFPLMNPYQATRFSGGERNNDLFYAKLSSDGQTLLYSTYFGGTGGDFLYTIAIDSNDRVALTGTTSSTDLPVKNAFQATSGGGYDPYVVVFELDGQSLSYCTYLGGSLDEQAWGLDFDSQNNLILGGYMNEYPSVGDVFQKNCNGLMDNYLAKFDPDGDILFLTFFGGTETEYLRKLAIDSQDNIYFTGQTYSDDYPLKNAFQRKIKSISDTFLSKISSDGTQVLFSTYFGGESTEFSLSIFFTLDDDPVITGSTTSPDFPTTILHDGFYDPSDSEDAFVAVFSSVSGDLKYSTKIGGSLLDRGIDVSISQNNTIILMGYTYSDDFPVKNAYLDSFQGVTDMFITHLYIEESTPKVPGYSSFITISIVSLIILSFFIKKKCRF